MLYKTSEEKSTEYNSTIDQENENQGEIIVSRSSSQSIQHPLPDKREALRLNNLPSTTLCAYVNHKVTLCKPITRSKAVSCAPITFNRATQTLLDDETPPISLLPIPVGLVTPLPLALGTTDCPVPVPVPIPVPFPLFFVVNDQKFQDYGTYLQKLKEIIPTNDEDIELLVYAQSLFPNDDLLGLGKFNPKSSLLDEVETEEMHIVGRTSNENNQIEQELTTGDNVLNKLIFDFEDFDLSTMALTSGEQNMNTNTSEKIEYLMRQEDAKYILKWHFGVKLFRAWIEDKNEPIKQRLFQQYTRTRNISYSDVENRLSKRLYRSDPLLYRADELNTALCLFLKERRDLYDGDSIYYLCLGIQHYLRENRSLSSQTTRRLNEGHFYRTIFHLPLIFSSKYLEKKMSSSNENIVLSAIGTRTVLNLLCKLLFRFLHFFLNALIFRQIDGNIIGIANVRLQLLYTTILFLSREAFRRTVPKLTDIRSVQLYINLIWSIVPVGLSIITFSLILCINTDNAEKYPYYYHACFFYAFAAFIEILSEPFYLLATVTLNYHINIYIEMFASTIGFTLQAFLIYKNSESALYYYGFGYIIYSLLITLSYYIYFLTRQNGERHRLFLITSFKDLLIRPTSPYVDYKLFSETKTFFYQGIWMKILTEGERYIMSIFNLVSYKDQGIFDTINNLGSLLPRLIFSTLEESAYAYFQQTLQRTKTIHDEHIQDDEMLVKPRQDEQINEVPPSPTEQQTIRLNALTFYNYLLRFVIITSLLVITFGIPYSRFLLNLYGGSNLIEGPGPLLLRLYCIYILFLAINGITEAFAQATINLSCFILYSN
ncbi:unnamed protein product [Adineta steineri]|uniref:Man(5)GlcNAc(2)-PP-dolichol translocation protein RFT1 n=1 Tax=Adineta steineri TaxID=433720 RepID=A0A814PBJ0_9BILA|nr:unnamed protein product [Adineta steineri]